ncbi:MAG: 4-(cytidine 5'-diphospho)-2-C-methyl-D-erythritol kinase [Negativicutes bacterium]|jgi:4-diphosphocytidyl-2-C-methyl-D-erythritol kinase
MIIEKAYAKINLLLDILHKRTDGYHEVDMIMQTISLHDEVRLLETAKGIVLRVAGAELAADESNLAYKAARLFFNETTIERGVEIDLIKYIPMEAGLAGGSADAAAVLRGLNKLFATNLSITELQYMSAKIGSDVAFCVAGGTARAVGRGEKILPVSSLPECSIVIFKPDFGISTAWAYGQFALHAEKIVHPNINKMLAALVAENLAGIADCMGNVLEAVSVGRYVQIEDIKSSLRINGALNSLMSGSGTAVFGIFEDERRANAAKAVLQKDFSGAAYVCKNQKLYF